MNAYDNAVTGQLTEAESELNFLDNAYSKFCQSVQGKRVEGSVLDWFSFGSDDNSTSTAVNDAYAAIGGSIEQLHESFDDASGGKDIAWDVWWSLAKDLEKQMNSVSAFAQQYGTVGGRLRVADTTVKDDVKEEIADATKSIKDALPSEGKIWLGVGVFVLVLFLMLAIKLS